MKAEQVKRMREALASLVCGVHELREEWPTLNLPFEERHNDLIGFLFATLPLAEQILGETYVWTCQQCELTTYDAPPNMDRQKAYDTGKNARKCPRCKSEGALVIQGW